MVDRLGEHFLILREVGMEMTYGDLEDSLEDAEGQEDEEEADDGDLGWWGDWW